MSVSVSVKSADCGPATPSHRAGEGEGASEAALRLPSPAGNSTPGGGAAARQWQQQRQAPPAGGAGLRTPPAAAAQWSPMSPSSPEDEAAGAGACRPGSARRHDCAVGGGGADTSGAPASAGRQWGLRSEDGASLSTSTSSDDW